jgi:hypothetical protein
MVYLLKKFNKNNLHILCMYNFCKNIKKFANYILNMIQFIIKF